MDQDTFHIAVLLHSGPLVHHPDEPVADSRVQPYQFACDEPFSSHPYACNSQPWYLVLSGRDFLSMRQIILLVLEKNILFLGGLTPLRTGACESVGVDPARRRTLAHITNTGTDSTYPLVTTALMFFI